MIITQAILFVDEPRFLRRRRLDPGIEIEDVIFELDVQTLLGGPRNVSLEDQALGSLVNVDRWRVAFPRRLDALLLRLGLDGLAGRGPTLTRMTGRSKLISSIPPAIHRFAQFEPSKRAGHAGGPGAVTVIRRGSGIFGFGYAHGQNPVGKRGPNLGCSQPDPAA